MDSAESETFAGTCLQLILKARRRGDAEICLEKK